jgi:hypothetical protein
LRRRWRTSPRRARKIDHVLFFFLFANGSFFCNHFFPLPSLTFLPTTVPLCCLIQFFVIQLFFYISNSPIRPSSTVLFYFQWLIVSINLFCSVYGVNWNESSQGMFKLFLRNAF